MPHHYSPPSFIHQSPRYTSPSDGKGPHGERFPYPETFVTYLPVSLVKELPLRPTPRSLFRDTLHPQNPLHPALKVPGRQALLQVPQTVPLWNEIPVYSSGSPAREPSLQVPFTELPQRETLHLQSPFHPHPKSPQ
jgi:hypothetical protein